MTELYADELAFFHGQRCDRRFRARVDWQRYFARVKRPARHNLPDDTVVCAPRFCDAAEVGRFLVPRFTLEEFNENDPGQWLRLDREVTVEEQRHVQTQKTHPAGQRAAESALPSAAQRQKNPPAHHGPQPAVEPAVERVEQLGVRLSWI